MSQLAYSTTQDLELDIDYSVEGAEYVDGKVVKDGSVLATVLTNGDLLDTHGHVLGLLPASMRPLDKAFREGQRGAGGGGEGKQGD